MDQLHSRELLAGYRRDVLEAAVVTVVGGGMLANNLVQTLALSGVGEIRVIDFDVIEPSNVTRSPLFRREHASPDKPRFKARELALSALAISYAHAPTVRFATERLESVGLGALVGSNAVAACVDNLPARVRLAEWTRLLGAPLIESGVNGHSGHVSVFPNRDADEPCYRCAFPTADTGSFSCRTYAEAAAAAGRIPATQALGAAFGGALVAEHTILALHGEFPLAGCFLSLDLRSGRTNRLGVRRDPLCPGGHRRLDGSGVETIDVGSRDPLESVFAAIRARVAQPRIALPTPYIVEAPCTNCGAGVRIGRPDWDVGAPRCKACGPSRVFTGRGVVSRAHMVAEDPESKRACRVFGYGPGALIDVEDGATGLVSTFRISGGADDIYVTKRRQLRNAKEPASETGTHITDSHETQGDSDA